MRASATFAAGLAALALVAPHLAGTAAAPSVAASAAQLIAPGTRVSEAPLTDGGFVRARALESVAEGTRIQDAEGWRVLPVTLAAAPCVRTAWLGTDQQGRDVLARTAHGARTSLGVAALAAVGTLLIGGAVGLARAFAGRAAEHALALVTDALLGLPRLLVVLALGLALARGIAGLALAIALASWMESARIVAAAARGYRASPFVEAARAGGASPLRIAWRHVAPQVLPLLTVALPLVATEAVLLEATLGYLGVGGASAASWGRLVADGQRLLPGGWWIAIFPGALIALVAATLAVASRRELAR